jgi:pyrimidine-nucleoside phosphorylase
LHTVDLIRKKRDGESLTLQEIRWLVDGAARQTIPEEQLAAWLMAAWLRGFSLTELDALTLAMRDSGEVLDHSSLGRFTVDKHSTGGVGDKTSFLVAPIVAAVGLADPMISGRALGHTGGTLDKLESIPGYHTQLSSSEMGQVLKQCGCSIVGQTEGLVPADRVLYALRDRTATVESPYLICASIMSKKLAAGLQGLVLDVKTGSGAFLQNERDVRFLAALMVSTGESAGTRTAAVITDMSQPLGRFAGNWVEIQETVELLQGSRPALSEDLRHVSLVLAGWMLHLGGKAESPEGGYTLAESKLTDGSALAAFRCMVQAHGGDLQPLEDPATFHRPAVRKTVVADHDGFFTSMDCTLAGWAVQRLGAGRERAGAPVEAHAGLEMHVKLGMPVTVGQPLYTLFTQKTELLVEPEQLMSRGTVIAKEPAEPPPLIQQVITRENKKLFLERADQ